MIVVKWVERTSRDLVRIHEAGGESRPWVRRVCRKPGRCAVTGEAFASGAKVFAPLGNGMKRYERILASWVEVWAGVPIDERAGK